MKLFIKRARDQHGLPIVTREEYYDGITPETILLQERIINTSRVLILIACIIGIIWIL
ncbi:MAG: hypothetical protein LR017_02200 [Candidatus Pacebacteria bacterium]|nr:hypothetical protein [Candidatus Paceibacterota bacterium]